MESQVMVKLNGRQQKRKLIYDKYGGRCAYCGCELNSEWQIDHAISRCYWFYLDKDSPTKVNSLENLMPSCKECNHYKRSRCVDNHHSHVGFRHYLLNFHKRLASLPKKTMVAKTKKRIVYMKTIADKYGITVDKPFSGIFYFETLSNPHQ